MKIHKEGYSTIIITLLFVLILIYITYILTPKDYKFIAFSLYLVYLTFWLFIISFFRYPKRSIQIHKNQIIAPADGKIVVIEETTETEYFKDQRMQISIFMSPLNVHANWYPISGVITYVKYHLGKHLIANHPKSSTENERSTIVVKAEDGQEILFRQVAGALARRIVCYSKLDDQAVQGDNFGFIKFGSRVDVFIPLSAKIKVHLDDEVTAKSTVLAEF